ncbi:MAG: putative lipoprotein [Pseudohongiellaceae bacterium]|jgi:predicted lipoprotein
MNWSKICLSVGLAFSVSACVDDSRGNSDAIATQGFDYSAMFANLADNVILPNYQQLATQANALADDNGALASYCSVIGSAGETAALSAAQADWRELMIAWQPTELHVVGPASDNDNALRNRINSFAETSLSSCGIDQSVVLSQSVGFDLSTRSNSQLGLGALEYLLFNSSLDHTCPPQIIETTGWDTRPDNERKLWRCKHAQKLASDIASASQSLLTTWQGDGGNYRSAFINPNNNAVQLKALSDALFAIEIDVKDNKLGIPLSLKSDCSQVACPQQTESFYAEQSLASIGGNLKGFEQIFFGVGGSSFDDIIIAEGFADVASNFQSLTTNAIDFNNSMSSSLFDQATAIVASGSDTDCLNSAANPDSDQTVPACSLHGYLKRITDALRTDFVTIVELDLPSRAQADND